MLGVEPIKASDAFDVSTRSMLRAELMTRCQKNPRYSTRAFARQIGMSPSYLTQLLNGARPVHERIAAELSVKLGFSDRKTSLFLCLAQRENAKDEVVRRKYEEIIAQLQVEDTDFFSIGLEHEFVIADWRHGAILEMTAFPHFRGDSRWIARKLGMTVAAAEVALERLIGIGLLERDDEGRIIKPFQHTTTPDVSAACIRRRHVGLLQEALKALEIQKPHERDFSSVVMAIDPARLAEAKERIAKFRRELMVFLEAGSQTELYQVSIQLFRLDKALKDDESEPSGATPDHVH